METILETALNEWKYKRDDYGDAFLELGSKGQFSEIWRKVKKLKRSVWEGYELRMESPDEIARDIIPHCLMMIYCLKQERRPR